MHRRNILSHAPLALALPAMAGPARAGDDRGDGPADLDAAARQFLTLPGTKSYLVHAGRRASLGRLEHQPDLFLFVASTIKTFVLGQYLRDVEAGLLSEDEPLAVDDGVRTVNSPVFMDLTGKTPARSVLEAMIAHSDNMATDAALLKVGADRVRALIAEAGLRRTLIPGSTRRLFCYISGAPLGVDLGWPGVVEALQNPPGSRRPIFNEVETMASTASDMVSWYEQALRGRFFSKPETLTEFRRVQAMGDAISGFVPPGTAAYAKGGSIEFDGFNCLSAAGQMVARAKHPVTFCFNLNWDSSEGSRADIQGQFTRAVGAVLGHVARALA